MERLLTLYSEVQSTDVRWLWYPFIAIGKITLLQGDPGDGKSSMMMNLIAELSTGGKPPDGCKIGAPQKVIYQCSEDGVSDTIKPRLERCGADCGKIAFINEEVYNGLTLDDERIRQAIIEFRPRLVVIDPIQAYLGSDAYLPEEVVELNDMTEMRSGKKSDMALLSDYLTVSGTCFINQSSPVMTISKNEIRFSKACHTRLDDCEDVELLYHPILQVVILRKNNCKSSTAMRWRDDNDVHSAFSARAFSGLVFQTLNWRRNCRYQCRGICQERENAKFLLFELDESRILIGKNHYEQAEGYSMNLECRLYRRKWVQSITARDVMESGQVVENPMIGAIPSRNEVQRELDDLLMSM